MKLTFVFMATGAWAVAAFLFVLSALPFDQGLYHTQYFNAGLACLALGFVISLMNSSAIVEMIERIQDMIS